MNDKMVETQARPVALVTGASGGIGLDLCRLLAARGHDLVLVARSEGRLAEIGRELAEKHGARCEVVAADLSRPEGVEAVAEGVKRLGLQVEVLVNNAGFGLWGSFAQTDLGAELEMIQLNVGSLTALTKRFLPGMLDRKRGRILNVASTAAFQPGPLMAVYYATKAYVLSFSEALHNELSGTGVTVTALCPGPTSTNFEAVAKLGDTKLFKVMRPMTSEAVARAGVDALMKGRRLVVPGLLFRFMAWSSSLAPRGLILSVVRRMQERAG